MLPALSLVATALFHLSVWLALTVNTLLPLFSVTQSTNQALALAVVILTDGVVLEPELLLVVGTGVVWSTPVKEIEPAPTSGFAPSNVTTTLLAPVAGAVFVYILFQLLVSIPTRSVKSDAA